MEESKLGKYIAITELNILHAIENQTDKELIKTLQIKLICYRYRIVHRNMVDINVGKVHK